MANKTKQSLDFGHIHYKESEACSEIIYGRRGISFLIDHKFKYNIDRESETRLDIIHI